MSENDREDPESDDLDDGDLDDGDLDTYQRAPWFRFDPKTFGLTLLGALAVGGLSYYVPGLGLVALLLGLWWLIRSAVAAGVRQGRSDRQ